MFHKMESYQSHWFIFKGYKELKGWLDFSFFDRKIKIQKFFFLKTIQVSTKIRYR